MKRAGLCFSITFAASACVSLQDLGSHSGVGDGGAGTDTGSNFQPFSEAGTSGSTSGETPPTGNGTVFFTTNGRWTGNLGGLAGADTLCTNEASAAGLGGKFKAWLSSSTVNAKARIGGAGPWKFVTGEEAFTLKNGMFTPSDFLRYDARGNDLMFTDAPNVWTGTGDFGVLDASNATCNDWTSDLAANNGSIGQLTWFNPLWTHYDQPDVPNGLVSCSQLQRLYCFQQ